MQEETPTPKGLTVWLLVMVVLFIVFFFNTPKCSAQQIVCNRQPMSGLEYKDNDKKFEAAEWHCTGTPEQAFALLSQSSIGPFTPATVNRFAAFTNRASLRERFIRGAMYAGMVVGPLAALNISEPVWRAVIGGAPIVSNLIKEIAGGLPVEFESTQASGYSVVYSMASSKNQIIQNQPLGLGAELLVSPVTESATLEFHPTDWYVLYRDTYQGRKKVIQQWQAVDESWKIEERVKELRDRMNFGEAEAVVASNRVLLATSK